jgi:hypothetical protein
MNLLNQLSNDLVKQGWSVSPESIQDFIDESNNNLNINQLIKKCLDSDLKSIGKKYITDSVATGKANSFDDKQGVVQLVKIRNIGAPKDNETNQTAPPMYKLTLTDGFSHCNALVIDSNYGNLNLNTPPGTKVLLKGPIKIKSNLLILNSKNSQILGGKVDHLIEKWKTTRDIQQHTRMTSLAETAPPPWVPFGRRLEQVIDTTQKVLGNENGNETNNDDSQFTQARQNALAEAMAAKLKITKTFVPSVIADNNQTKTGVDKTNTINNSGRFPPTDSSAFAPKSAFLRQNKEIHAPQKTSNSETTTKTKGKLRKGIDFDDENDYRDVKDAPKPGPVTLFDMLKTKIDIKGKILLFFFTNFNVF